MVLVAHDKLDQVREAALDRAPISLGTRRTASPHEFYRHPARFAPQFARSVIDAFTEPGDLVADYFAGGGTTLVEARRAGRCSVGTDINSLSVFVTGVKTATYTSRELRQVAAWAEDIASLNLERAYLPTVDLENYYFRNIGGDELEVQRGVLQFGVERASDLLPKARDFARCVLLRSAQSAFDMRRDVLDGEHLRRTIVENAAAMAGVARRATMEYARADDLAGETRIPRTLIVHQGLPGIGKHPALSNHPAPRLVLTSPPYPGVYVNYHRWKVRGRRETPFPYYLAGQEDGNGLAYYTMAARSDPSQRTYFSKLEASFADIASVCDADTKVVQVVGFNDVTDHLARYLVAMQNAGFAEIRFDALSTASDGRLWRDVPGRRWWAHAGDRSTVAPHTAHEVVLIHQLAR